MNTLRSPDGKIEITIQTANQFKRTTYVSTSLGNKPVINSGKIKLRRRGTKTSAKKGGAK